MEIERKFLVKSLPAELSQYRKEEMEQGYLSVDPVVRVRKSNENYYITYKSSGMMARREFNEPLTKDSYEHLLKKADGYIITKTRYLIPVSETEKWDEPHEAELAKENEVGHGKVIELDVFHGSFEGLVLAEIEFEDEESANKFVMPSCFQEDVTFDGRYHNSHMSKFGPEKIKNVKRK